MATLTWDHAVQFVNQPEAAIQALSGQKLNAVVGGRHPGWGTRNALSYFGLTYIEFLAIADDAELLSAAETFLLCRDASRLLPDNEALYRVALRSDDIERTHAELHEQGLRVSPIVNGTSATIRRATLSAGGSSPLTAILTAWSIPSFCNGGKRMTPG